MPNRPTLFASALFLIALCPNAAFTDTLKITSNPPGATVEIDGVSVGVTPYEEEVPGGYFHKTKTVLGRRLEHPMVARISLAGYATKEIQMTDGPMNWVSLKGHSHGEYWLLKMKHFHVDLDPVGKIFTGIVAADVSEASAVLNDPDPQLSVEDIVARSKPAVLYLKGSSKSGSGFFITQTGVIATNAHLARGEQSLLATLANGQQLDAKVVYIDADRDVALAKIDGDAFPYLGLATAGSVRQGQTVVAIGNPGGAMSFSVTKGVVSAIGKFSSAGPGIWIQTDASINPGNSGGPLLNSRGKVIGINTLKLEKKNVTGIGFALSASDLLSVLQRFYPALDSAAKQPVP
jgi:S1-C subfamily serine protease